MLTAFKGAESERKSTAQKKKREGAKGKKVVSNTKAATVRMARGGQVPDPKPKRPIVGKKQNGKAVARGCGVILADREKYTKGSVTQS